MAHKKAVSSTQNIRDSRSKRRGVKRFASTTVQSGHILVRQKGNRVFAGEGVDMGVDFTLYATREGVVRYYEKRRRRFDKHVERKVFVTVDLVA